MNTVTITVEQARLEDMIAHLNSLGYYVKKGEPKGDRIILIAVKSLGVGNVS